MDMRKTTLMILAALIAITGSRAQTSDNDSVPYYGMWDPIAEIYWISTNDRDTVASCVALGVRGDVLTGYNLYAADPESAQAKRLGRFLLYQASEDKEALKQIVLTTEKWDVPCMATLYPEVLGYRFRAVNEREKAELDSLGLILGEAFQCRSMGDPDTTWKSLELLVFPREHETSSDEANGYELLHFEDTTGVCYMSVGINACLYYADYTPWMTDGRYNTRYFTFDNDGGEIKRWMDRTRRILGDRDPGEPTPPPTRANPIIARDPWQLKGGGE